MPGVEASTKPTTFRTHMQLQDILEGLEHHGLDPTLARTFQDLGIEEDPVLVMELIELFLVDAPRLFAEIQGKSGNGDFGSLQRAAHTLKSSSATMGATGLSEVCKRMEAAARDRNLDGFQGLLEACQQELSESEQALRNISQWIGSKSSA